MLTADAADSGDLDVFNASRCVTSVLSRDTVRCSCSDITGYIAVLAPLITIDVSHISISSFRQRYNKHRAYVVTSTTK